MNEAVARIWHVLDGQEEVKISENGTFTSFRIGEHNVTVYAENPAVHVGFSETAIFTIAKPKLFPKNMIIAPFASVSFLGLSGGVYLEKRKKWCYEKNLNLIFTQTQKKNGILNVLFAFGSFPSCTAIYGCGSS